MVIVKRMKKHFIKGKKVKVRQIQTFDNSIICFFYSKQSNVDVCLHNKSCLKFSYKAKMKGVTIKGNSSISYRFDVPFEPTR